ncbi:MAG: polysaccharide biosynthesis protein [Oscillospiraceae bacterium]|nr:polysaccharide biosynthesis protein [Oscillospiraceae bacterium]
MFLLKLHGQYHLTRSSLLVVLADVVALNAAAILTFALVALLSPQDFRVLSFGRMTSLWMQIALPYTIISVLVFFAFRLYQMIWSMVSLREIVRVAPAVVISCLIGIVLDRKVSAPPLKLSVWFVIFAFTLLFVVAVRCSYRVVRLYLGRPQGATRIMVIGAGKAGQAILKEINNTPLLNRRVCCVIDDNPQKRGKYLEGVPVVGNCASIGKNVERFKIDEIIFAIPSAQPSQRRHILELCNLTKCKTKALPGIYQIIGGEVNFSTLRDVSVEDLLARDAIRVDNSDVLENMKDKTVLVTGGGGSIGSELCRQIASHRPGKLLIFDISENGVYDVQQELRRQYPKLQLEVRIGSVRDADRLDELFREFRPDYVFHAAAHKHVPLMEDSPCEAIKNNVFGTLNCAMMADKYHAESFLLISTDKAVNPTNIMGASKRLCEMVIAYMSARSETKFVAVRFGNVLGSNGSVVPLFRRQIEEGGPVTVTDKDIIRYFMTIPEAVALILQAHAFAKNGEVYVLDMGEPVRIDDMARQMIRMYGLEPDVDIPIVYTGLRPGEKRYEELLMDEEGLKKTSNELIFIGKPMELDCERFERDLTRLRAAADENDETIKSLVAEIVPTYTGAKVPVGV